MNLTDSIQALLYDHECVVIPQFGGFVTNYKAAFVHPKKQSVHPPSKQLAFNVNLKTNDGLLANYISQTENVSYESALNYVQNTVEEYATSLENDKRLELEGLGILSKNIQGGIEFTPSNEKNFFRKSFGLTPVFLPSLSELLGQEEELEETTTSDEADIISIAPETIEETPVISIERKKRRKNLVAAALFLPLMFLGGVTVQKNQPHLASFFDGVFKSPLTKSADYTPRLQDEKVLFTYDFQGNDIEIIAEQNPELQSIYYSFEKGEISPEGVKIILDSNDSNIEATKTVSTITPIYQPIPAKVTNKPSTSKLGLYFTVAGAFGEKSNAEKLVRRLKAKGYDATIFAKRGKLHMVCYGSYINKSAANSALFEIQKTENPDAWLKKH